MSLFKIQLCIKSEFVLVAHSLAVVYFLGLVNPETSEFLCSSMKFVF